MTVGIKQHIKCTVRNGQMVLEQSELCLSWALSVKTSEWTSCYGVLAQTVLFLSYTFHQGIWWLRNTRSVAVACPHLLAVALSLLSWCYHGSFSSLACFSGQYVLMKLPPTFLAVSIIIFLFLLLMSSAGCRHLLTKPDQPLHITPENFASEWSISSTFVFPHSFSRSERNR